MSPFPQCIQPEHVLHSHQRGRPTTAVAALPDITGKTVVKAALPAPAQTGLDRTAVRDHIERLTAENAADIRMKMLELLEQSARRD